jgi:hypothetical protein
MFDLTDIFELKFSSVVGNFNLEWLNWIVLIFLVKFWGVGMLLTRAHCLEVLSQNVGIVIVDRLFVSR